MVSVHNPDQHMAALRTIIAQGRKRVGLLVGAGAPAGMTTEDGKGPLIPAVAGLTEKVIQSITPTYGDQVEALRKSLPKHDIETILSRVRALASVLGEVEVHGLDGSGYQQMADAICTEIGQVVNVQLPNTPNPYSELVSWIIGAARDHPVEIFTTNYDLLFEEAFERSQAPYFDGFTGSREAFFDTSSVSGHELAPRWTKLWKLHGSLGWSTNSAGEIVRTGQATATNLVYPEHLKYAQTQKAPYVALLDRLSTFLMMEDTLLISIGFSFADAHISSRINDALAANAAGSVFAFQYMPLEMEEFARQLALRRPNFSLYARNKAIVNGISGDWIAPNDLPTKDWGPIRASYWGPPQSGDTMEFKLGAIDAFARFFAASRTAQITEPQIVTEEAKAENP